MFSQQDVLPPPMFVGSGKTNNRQGRLFCCSRNKVKICVGAETDVVFNPPGRYVQPASTGFRFKGTVDFVKKVSLFNILLALGNSLEVFYKYKSR